VVRLLPANYQRNDCLDLSGIGQIEK
jgi:hypothetical protein